MVKRSSIFVDTNYFLALQNRTDSLHKQALRKTQKMSDTQPLMVISTFIFLEVVTILSRQSVRAKAKGYGKDLLDSQNIKIIHIDRKLHADTWKIFCSIAKKNVGFVDCSVLAVMKAHDIKHLLTFDRKDFSSLKKKYDFDFF